jgi:branched-chain amino acid transport system substrate-binding protein
MGDSFVRRSKVFVVCAFAGAAVLALSACSSSGKATSGSSAAGGSGGSSAGGSAGASGGSSSSASGGKPIKVGVITDTTGGGASGFQTTETGIKAYFNAVNAAGGVNGQKIEYVMADSQTSPAATLSATQKLVQTDKVFAILSVTSTWYAAEAYALKEGVPVVGAGFDGNEWSDPKNTNLFQVTGVNDYSKVYANTGQFFKTEGVTTCGAFGYSDSPSSAKGSQNDVKSCQAAGLKAGPVALIAFGSTDVAPTALSMKKAGVDGVDMGVDPSSGFALGAALRTVGAQTKVVLNATGYGGDLLQSSAAVTAAQGYYFSSSGQPIEQNTPATQTLKKNLAAVGYNGTPTYAIQSAYFAAAGFVAGLKATGANPSRQQFMDSLRKVSDFDADGLLSPEKINFNDYAPAQSCMWVVKLEGKTFTPVTGSPFCAGTI